MLAQPYREVFFLLIVYLAQFLSGTHCEQQLFFGRSSEIEKQQPPASNQEIAHDAKRAERVDRAVSNKGPNYNRVSEDECYGDFINNCLQTHDMYRSMHGVSPLEPNKKLMAYAQQRANELAKTEILAHPAHSAYGENLAFSSQKESTCSDLIEMWYDELRMYNWQNPSFNMAIGHFSQLVWRDSVRIGCARSFSNRGVYLACNYDPPGNVMGQFKSQVTPPKRGPKENISPSNYVNSNCLQTNT